MIQYVQADGLFYPVIACDHCEGVISSNGNVYWLMMDNGHLYPWPWFVHKGCASYDTVIVDKYGGTVLFEELSEFLQELSELLQQLQHNFTADARF